MDGSLPTGIAPESAPVVPGSAVDHEPRLGAVDLTSSSSGLSDAPNLPLTAPESELAAATDSTNGPAEIASIQTSGQSTESPGIVVNDSIDTTVEGATNAGTPEGEVAKEQDLTLMATPATFPPVDTPTPGIVRGRARGVGRGRGGGRPRGSRARGRGIGFAGSASGGNGETTASPLGDSVQISAFVKPRGRGRGGGRPRGSRARGGGRGGKRKREDGDDDDDDGDESDSSEVTPIATMTKSGRSVQKPTSFVPPAPSPINPNKRKRPYTRRNPEAAVCKVCLRGSSPATNMIVFCDGCNLAYHRYCHQPPIDQAVIDVLDKEWFCRHCESERALPVPQAEVAGFVSAEGATAEQRQQYFSTLAPGVLITLLTKITTLHPELPVFAPSFKASIDSSAIGAVSTDTGPAQTPAPIPPPPVNHAQRGQYASLMPPPPPQPSFGQGSSPKAVAPKVPAEAREEYYGPDVHPTKYPRPGQGLMSTLPPDKDDLQWLVEDDRFGVFTHLYQPNQTITDATATGHARADASLAGTKA